MRPLIFLVLSRYGLACKYRIISQISIYNWMQNCIFRYFWYCIFIFQRSKYISNCSRKSTLNSQQYLKDFLKLSRYFTIFISSFLSYSLLSLFKLSYTKKHHVCNLYPMSHTLSFSFETHYLMLKIKICVK